MYRDIDRYKVFSRRAFLLGAASIGLFSGLAGRMYFLQVVESERYATLADDNRISLRLLSPPRGRIVDRFGRPMAVNRQNYRALVIPEDVRDLEAALDRLGGIIPISQRDRTRIRHEVKRNRKFLPVLVRDNLSWRDVARIEVNAPDLGGISIDVGQSRHYLEGVALAPVLGYVGRVTEDELTGDPLLELPGFRIGKTGIEKTHDLALRGRGGTSQVEVNALGRAIRELKRIEGAPGVEAQLTIDLELQKFVSERLGAQAASAVVIDVHSGEVLSLVSTPSFDPNAFNRGLSNEEWRSLVSNPRSPLSNKAIAGQYAPGSTFKMMVALAALEKGVIDPNTRVFCEGKIELGDAVFHCWKRRGHGGMDLHNGITQSCDVYFYELAKRTGIDRISAMARRFGFGEVLGIDLPGEKSGLMPTRDWKLATQGTPWQQGETVLAGIGQGFMLATPLQLVVMMARLVNGGRAVIPRLTRRLLVDGEGPLLGPADGYRSIGVHAAHMELMGKAMAAVVNSPVGTAYRARVKEPGFEMGGKTGTVQVRRITLAEREQGVRKNKDLPWRQRDHALFVGYAPVDAPRYAVSVVVEHGGGGSSTAAPIGRDILIEVQRRDPTGGAPGDFAGAAARRPGKKG